MTVNTNGCAVYAHASLSMNEIVAIIQRSEDLISKFNVLSPADIADTGLFSAWFGDSKTLVRTRGRDASKVYAGAHIPVVCECGCTLEDWLEERTRLKANMFIERNYI